MKVRLLGSPGLDDSTLVPVTGVTLLVRSLLPSATGNGFCATSQDIQPRLCLQYFSRRIMAVAGEIVPLGVVVVLFDT